MRDSHIEGCEQEGEDLRGANFGNDRHGTFVPSHRNPNKQRTVSILKSKKSNMGSRFIRNNAHQWGQRFYDGGSGDSSASDGGDEINHNGNMAKARPPPSDKTIT